MRISRYKYIRIKIRILDFKWRNIIYRVAKRNRNGDNRPDSDDNAKNVSWLTSPLGV